MFPKREPLKKIAHISKWLADCWENLGMIKMLFPNNVSNQKTLFPSHFA
jgi:hypothetical protein